ncbi:Protein of unknown function [Pyronema omphalodes CBS 100304]|uniref:Uncharacterized protein n=1 Tax=Pyronema omphalodes (strain CBS 100304) TaxID=1076935 RepID=U4LKS3_PYROM|nr:Protein of unknown function [Pyronema omphalodes CBS 100304]
MFSPPSILHPPPVRETPARIQPLLSDIDLCCGYPDLNICEFFLGLSTHIFHSAVSTTSRITHSTLRNPQLHNPSLYNTPRTTRRISLPISLHNLRVENLIQGRLKLAGFRANAADISKHN